MRTLHDFENAGKEAVTQAFQKKIAEIL